MYLLIQQLVSLKIYLHVQKNFINLIIKACINILGITLKKLAKHKYCINNLIPDYYE